MADDELPPSGLYDRHEVVSHLYIVPDAVRYPDWALVADLSHRWKNPRVSFSLDIGLERCQKSV